MNIIILCGGKGSRLWPLSREKLPKQFLPLVDSKTMFQNTILRFQNLKKLNITVNKYIIICNTEHEFIVNEQLSELNFWWILKMPLENQYLKLLSLELLNR